MIKQFGHNTKDKLKAMKAMANEQDFVQTTMRIPSRIHKRLKDYCYFNEMTINDYVITLMNKHLPDKS